MGTYLSSDYLVHLHIRTTPRADALVQDQSLRRIFQLFLDPTSDLKLAVPFPNLTGYPKLVAIPKISQMGWTEYPPAFSAATETISNLINIYLESPNAMTQPHPLEALDSTPVSPEPSKLYP